MSELREPRSVQPLIFWQPNLSIHQTPLLAQVAVDWHGPVHLVVDKIHPEKRVKDSGWQVGSPNGVFVTTDGTSLPTEAIHVVSGFRGTHQWRNNRRRVLADSSARIWIMSESLPTWDSPLKVALRFARHGIAYFSLRRHLEGFFAIGKKAEDQARKIGMPSESVIPFCYVTSPPTAAQSATKSSDAVAEVLFIGNLSRRKGVDLLFSVDFGPSTRLRIIGAPSADKIEIPETAEYLGTIPNEKISSYLRDADLLILPSRHDGWGAVINEALMAGTPVVCSQECGGETLVRGTNPFRGKVMSTVTPDTIDAAIRTVLGSKLNRETIALWARKAIAPEVVAKYMVENLLGERPAAPWQEEL